MRNILLACLLLAAPGLAFAQAQATIKPDGEFRYALGAGASYAAGNISLSALTSAIEAAP